MSDSVKLHVNKGLPVSYSLNSLKGRGFSYCSIIGQ